MFIIKGSNPVKFINRSSDKLTIEFDSAKPRGCNCGQVKDFKITIGVNNLVMTVLVE